ncbi:MAG: MATE family efflux transporter [Peptostreptococcaceae bacterium]
MEVNLTPNTVKKNDFYKTIAAITIPIALQNIISYGVNLMDTVMLGRLGEIALSATSLANQVFFMFTLLIFGIGGGAVVLCSQYWGNRNIKSIQKITTIVLKIAFWVSLGFALVLLIFPKEVMTIFTSDVEVIKAGTSYLRVLSMSYLFYGLTSTFLVILRSVETVNICLKIYILSFIVNVVFNYIFIFGKFGVPALGVTGAAVGTLIARMVEFIIILIYMLKYEKKIFYRPHMLKFKDKDLLKDMIKYGMPVICNELLWGVGISIHAIILGHLSSDVVAANSICNVIYQMSTSFILGVANASSVVMGKTVGAGNKEEAIAIKNKLLFIYLILGITTASVLLIIKNPVISMYNIETTTKAIANKLMYVYAFHILFQAFTSPIIAGVLRGGGDTKFAAVVDVLFLWLLLPVGFIVAFKFNLNPILVLLLLRFETPIKTVFCLWRLKGDKWINIITR